MRESKIPKKNNKQPSISSFTDLKYMDDDSEDVPSAQHLQDIPPIKQYSNVNELNKSSNSQNNSQTNSQQLGSKVIRKKARMQQKQKITSAPSQIKRTPSQPSLQKNSSMPKSFSFRKLAQFKQVKYEQFQLICQTFSMFGKSNIDFNEMIMGLKSIGVQIQTEKKFQMISNIFEQIKKPNMGVQFQHFASIAVKLLKEEKTKMNSEINQLQKAYYCMIQQGNNIGQNNIIQIDNHIRNSTSLQSIDEYQNYKAFVQRQPSFQKYLTSGSLQTLVKYLGVQSQFQAADIESIMKYVDRGDKGYISFEDVISSIHFNKIVDI